MPLYLESWNTDRHHSGILVSEQLPSGEMLRRLMRFAESVAATEMHDLIRNLAEFKQINEE